MVTIINYGMGNIGSLENMLNRLGSEVNIAASSSDFDKTSKLILPGVGHFDHAMANLQALDLIDVLNYKVIKEKIPILCICLGAQLIMEKSEEGTKPGLGWVEGKVIRFHFSKENKLRIPHMGWNTVNVKREAPLFMNIEAPRFYFVHSYHLICTNQDDIMATSVYGYEFVAGVQHDNIYATQFHPEKSHKFGMQLIKNFLEI
ncbi:MAG: imidazole glycerol phosphate synthase subunit HisH [Syntrophomonas sp.]